MGNARPYLVITLVHRPREGVDTSKKGWAENPRNITAFERPVVTDRLTRKIETEASFIIDIMQQRVVKSRLEKPEHEVVNYFLDKYDDLIKRGLNAWSRKLIK